MKVTNILPAETHAVRPDIAFSHTILPQRVMVLDRFGNPLGLGETTAIHLQGGHLTGYRVHLDAGDFISVWPSQVCSPDNVIMPMPSAWSRQTGHA